MIELNEAHATLRQAARHQAIVGKTGFARLRAVSREHRGGFLVDVHGVGGVHLHAERHLVLRDARNGFRIAELGIGLLIDFVDRIQHAAAQRTAYVRRVFQVEHRLAVGAALHALINTGQKARAPQLFAAVRLVAARDQHDETGKILILRAQPVDHPGTERRIAEASIAGLHQQLRRRMVELIGAHGLDEAKVVNVLFQMRQAVRHPLTAFPAW